MKVDVICIILEKWEIPYQIMQVKLWKCDEDKIDEHGSKKEVEDKVWAVAEKIHTKLKREDVDIVVYAKDVEENED